MDDLQLGVGDRSLRDRIDVVTVLYGWWLKCN